MSYTFIVDNERIGNVVWVCSQFDLIVRIVVRIIADALLGCFPLIFLIQRILLHCLWLENIIRHDYSIFVDSV